MPYNTQQRLDSQKNVELDHELTVNISKMKQYLGDSSNIIIQSVILDDTETVFIYISGLIDEQKINEIMKTAKIECKHRSQKEDVFHLLKEMISICVAKEFTIFDQMIQNLLSGSLIVLVNGCATALSFDIAGGKVRDIAPPQTQTVVRGPKDSFTESIQINQSLIRRRLKSPNLRVKSLEIGNISNTTVSVVYLHSIVNFNFLQIFYNLIQYFWIISPFLIAAKAVHRL